jgi:basic membrane protein A
MDYVEGEDLDHMLNRLGALPEPQVLSWITQICDALAYLHNQPSPIIHRDIKPANIKIRPDGRAILVDFGIAKVYDPHLVTTIGAKAVTPGYSPPEQYGGSPTDRRSDIYALGATLYHLLTGQKPPESVQRAVGGATIVLPRTINQQISPQVEQAVLKAIEVATERRFQSVDELRSALNQPTPPQPEPQPPVETEAPKTKISPPVKKPPVDAKERRSEKKRSPVLWVGLLGGASVIVILLVIIGLTAWGSLAGKEPAATPTQAVSQLIEKPASTPIPTLPPAPQPPDCSLIDVLCVGLVTDVGKIDDKSFNQSAWEGLKQAEAEFGAIIQYIETTDSKDYTKNISVFVEARYDVIVTVGFALGEATTSVAKQNPQVKFIGVDQFQTEVLPNVAGLIFPEDKAAFLVGALAAMMSRKGQIGAVLGTDAVPAVWRFGEGYRAGAQYINPGIQVNTIYHNDVGFDKTFVDPEWGKVIALSMIDKGVDVIFGAGGKTGNGALLGAAERGIYCIGVDTDQFFTVPEAQSCLLTSAIKRIDGGILELIGLAREGIFPGGNFTGQAGYAPFHNFESLIPADVKARLEEIDRSLRDGSLQTEVPEAKPGG